MSKQLKIIVEQHPDGYVAYPLEVNGVVVGEGDTYEEALMDAKSAIAFHIETFYERDLLDYTQWRQNLFAELSGEEISRQAMELQRRKQASDKMPR